MVHSIPLIVFFLFNDTIIYKTSKQKRILKRGLLNSNSYPKSNKLRNIYTNDTQKSKKTWCTCLNSRCMLHIGYCYSGKSLLEFVLMYLTNIIFENRWKNDINIVAILPYNDCQLYWCSVANDDSYYRETKEIWMYTLLYLLLTVHHEHWGQLYQFLFLIGCFFFQFNCLLCILTLFFCLALAIFEKHTDKIAWL